MIRTRFSTKDSFEHCTYLGRNSAFAINGDEAPSKYRRNRYGKLTTTVNELMPERTEVSFLAMVKMAGGELGKVVQCHLKDIARQKGVAKTNLSNPKVLGPLREDIKRLLRVGVRINISGKITGKKELCFNDTLIRGGISKDDWVTFSVSEHLVKVIKDSKQGYFYVQYRIYSKLRSPIARRSYLFLVGQSKIRAGKEYKIDLEKFCSHIGYYVGEDIKWSVLRDRLRPGLKELDGIDEWKHSHKFEGRGAGFLIAQSNGKKPDKSANRKKTTTPYREVIDKIKDALFEEFDTKNLWNEGKLINQLEALEKYLKSTSKQSLKYFVINYCNWLPSNVKDLYYSTALFDPQQNIFKQFEEVENTDQPRGWDNLMITEDKPMTEREYLEKYAN